MNTAPLIRRACAVLAALVSTSTASVAIGSPLPKPTGYFTRASVIYADPSDGGVDSGYGLAAQLGAAYDAGEFSIEAGQLRFDQNERFDLGDGYIVDAHGDLRASTLLLSGRIGTRFGSRKQVTLRFGVAGGVADLRVSAHVSDGEFEGGLTTRETAGVYAGDVSVAYAINEKLELSIDFRYMVATSTTFEIEGVEIESGDLKVNLFSLGLAYRW